MLKRLFAPAFMSVFIITGFCRRRLAAHVNGRDYLTVDNISKFYGFPADVAPSERNQTRDGEESARIYRR
jgi:hypothetical protein